MPYKLTHDNGKWCVVNEETGKNEGCSDTRAEGLKHLRALYANVPDADKAAQGIGPHSVKLYMPWAPHVIKGVDENGYDFRLVYGIMSDTSLDMDKQRCDPNFLRKAIPEWYEEWGNIRAMHKGEAVGTAVGLEEVEKDSWYLTSKIVDPDAIMKIDTGVYKGYSINVAWPHVRKDASAPMGIIDDGTIVETSVVDRPANSNAKIALLKAVGLKKDAASCCDSDCPQCDPDDCDDCQNGDCDCGDSQKDAAGNSNVVGPENDQDFNGDPEDSTGDAIAAREDEKGAKGQKSRGTTEEGWAWHISEAAKAANSSKDDQPRKSPPKGYPTDKSQYADPTNYRYPIDPKHIHAAISYYNAGAGKEGTENWTSIGQRIAAAASRIYGKPYVLQGGKVVPKDDDSKEKMVALRAKITSSLKKGPVNEDEVSVAELLSLGEMDDAELALIIADLVRYLMIRELHENAEPGENMAQTMSVLGNVYQTMLNVSQNEAEEAWEYMAEQIVSQLLTSHGLDQTVQDAANGTKENVEPVIDQAGNPKGASGAVGSVNFGLSDALAIICQAAKSGAQFSSSNLGMIAQAHDALTKMLNGELCAKYMKGTAGSGNTDSGGAGNLNPEDAQGTDANDTSLKGAGATAIHGEELPVWAKAVIDSLNQEITGLKETVKMLGDRPLDTGSPLQTMIVKTVKDDKRSVQRAELEQKAARYKIVMSEHTDPTIRSDAAIKYGQAMRELEALGGEIH